MTLESTLTRLCIGHDVFMMKACESCETTPGLGERVNVCAQARVHCLCLHIRCLLCSKCTFPCIAVVSEDLNMFCLTSHSSLRHIWYRARVGSNGNCSAL